MNSKRFVLIAGLCVLGCCACDNPAPSVFRGQAPAAVPATSVSNVAAVATDTGSGQDAVPEPDESNEPEELRVGWRVKGDFDGDGIQEYATVVKVKEGEGNPVEDGTPDGYEVQFSSPKLPAFDAYCCEIRLVNEEDLNKDGADELSLYQGPLNGCVYTMTTYSFKTGKAAVVVPAFLIPTGCVGLSDKALEERVFAEPDGLYFYNIDMSDESMPMKKYKVK